MQNEAPPSDSSKDVLAGKRVHEHHYVHISAISTLASDQQANIAEAAAFAKLSPKCDFHVVKLHRDGEELSLLSYPAFFDDPFPTLACSWRVSLSRKTVVFRNYAESRNPPILHRKELLLPPCNPQIAEFSLITESAQTLGLFDEPNKIGFREHWYRLIAERGYELVGNEFVPLANATASQSDTASETAASVQRHRTALRRRAELQLVRLCPQ